MASTKKPIEQKFLELIEDNFMSGIDEDAKHRVLRDEIVADGSSFAEHFTVAERLHLVKVCDGM
jgi:hypothetical protein